MHAPSQNKPRQAQLVLALLETLARAGGGARARDVASALADRYKLPGSVRCETVVTGDGQVVNLWERHVRFARERAKAIGYVESPTRGTWNLTEAGRIGLASQQRAVRVTIFVSADGVPRHAQIEGVSVLPSVETTHLYHCGDARDLSWITDGSVNLIVTSTPYFDRIEYADDVFGQLGDHSEYSVFLSELDRVFAECYRILTPGGKAAINVAPVVLSRSEAGIHHLLDLPADVSVRCRSLGFLGLNGISWRKRTRVGHEQPGRGAFLGKPNQPNGVIPCSEERIILLKKPGTYQSRPEAVRALSHIPTDEYSRLFSGLWDDIPGVRRKPVTDADHHPAEFPVEIASRLIRMLSFAGDTVFDPCAGRGAVGIGSMRTGRHSVCNELVPRYHASAIRRGDAEARVLTNAA